MFNNRKSEEISPKNIELLIDKFQSKNIYLTSYEATDKIFNKYTSIDEMLLQYEFDKTNIGMFLFENFVNYLTTQNGSSIIFH